MSDEAYFTMIPGAFLCMECKRYEPVNARAERIQCACGRTYRIPWDDGKAVRVTAEPTLRPKEPKC